MITEKTMRVQKKGSAPSYSEMAQEFTNLHWGDIVEWVPRIETAESLEHLSEVWDTDIPVTGDTSGLSEEARLLAIKLAIISGLMFYGPWKDRDKMIFRVMDKVDTIAGRKFCLFIRGYWIS